MLILNYQIFFLYLDLCFLFFTHVTYIELEASLSLSLSLYIYNFFFYLVHVTCVLIFYSKIGYAGLM